MTQIAITGANGFIGSQLVRAVLREGEVPVAVTRDRTTERHPPAAIVHRIADYMDTRALAGAFDGCSCVVHLADSPSRHRQDRTAPAPADRAAAVVDAMRLAGISRVIYASSIYARPGFRSFSIYGEAKSGAERVFAEAGWVEPIILRLPPVHGEGGGGGYALLERVIRIGLPLPFANLSAPRSYLDVRALGQLILHLMGLPDEAWTNVAAASPLEPSDGPPLGTADLIRVIAAQQERRVLLFPLPTQMLELLGRLLGLDLRALSQPLVAQSPDEVEAITGWRAGERFQTGAERCSSPAQ